MGKLRLPYYNTFNTFSNVAVDLGRPKLLGFEDPTVERTIAGSSFAMHHARWLRAGLVLAICVAMSGALASCESQHTEALSPPSRAQQIQNAIDSQLRLDPAFRRRYILEQKFAPL